MDMVTEGTHPLIASSRVTGTPVYGRDGDHIGSVENLMIEKRGGRVTSAIVSIGGFLGIGEKYHPIPWEKLTYDEDLNGYHLDVTEDKLKEAPMFEDAAAKDAFTRENEELIYGYYGVAPYWL